MSKACLVTGSASGLGRNIAEAVLASGDRLVATARDPLRLEDLVQRYGNQVRTARRNLKILCASPNQRFGSATSGIRHLTSPCEQVPQCLLDGCLSTVIRPSYSIESVEFHQRLIVAWKV